jgi:atypical dual specificity phosphatase
VDAAPDFGFFLNSHQRLTAWLRSGIEVVISFREVEPLAREYGILGFEFHNIPIVDFDIPDSSAIESFIAIMKRSLNRKVLLHCLAGLGRSGTMAALFLKYQGMSAEQAIDHVRRCRPGSIQTQAQLDIVLDYSFDVE